jgi:hypothetical protein
MTPARLASLALLLLLTAACAASTPQEAVARYGDALASDDPQAAWELLAPPLQQKLGRDAFLAAWEARRQSLLPSAPELQRAAQRPARVSARLDYSDYDTLSLKLTADGWRITGGVLDLYSQDSPRKSLITFVRAAERGRFDVILKLIPSQYARHMTPEGLRADFEARADEIKALLTQLKANLHNPIELREDRAFLNYGAQQVRFVLEGDAWKIEDLD